MKYVKPQRITLKNNAELTERWVQDRIVEDPAILGLGEELVVKDRERMQPASGRLDLLLQDMESNRRYEVEVQLGATDASHIVRTIEYWDIERKRYPQYDHCAVLVSEDITSRFLNVISLFNGFIPIVAIQLSALHIGEQVALVMTTVMDELRLGLDDDAEPPMPTDRAYWETRATKATVALADELLAIVTTFDAGFALKYNKHYIGIAKNSQPNNFAIFRPKKEHLRLEIRSDQGEDIQKRLEEAGIDIMDYDRRWNRIRLRLTKADVEKNGSLLESLLRQAYQSTVGE